MSPTLLCLHGWGGSKESFDALRTALEGSGITILAPDLPGFGTEPEPQQPWTNDDYADWVEHWVQSRVSSHEFRVSLLGHSHGGRIAMKLAARGTLPIEHLYLCAPAGVRRGQYLKRVTGFILAKTGKLLLSFPLLVSHFQPLARRLLYRLLRVHDYEVASPTMKRTMVQVTTENMRPFLPKMKVPTDIFWGEEDRVTPYGNASLMQAGISGSILHSYSGVRHAVHKDKAREIAEVIRARMRA